MDSLGEADVGGGASAQPSLEEIKTALAELETEIESEARDDLGAGKEGAIATAGAPVGAGGKKRADRPLLRRKSELPKDANTVKTLGEYQRAEAFLPSAPGEAAIETLTGTLGNTCAISVASAVVIEAQDALPFMWQEIISPSAGV